MNITPFTILVGISLVLGVVSLVKPTWPLQGVAIVLLSTALLIGKA